MAQRTIRSDAEVQKAVLEELQWDGRVLAPDVGVEVNNRVVTLTGTVDSYAKREAAQEAAHRVGGVLDVANNVRVQIPHVGARTDTDVAQAVRQALEWNIFVPHEQIQTTVVDGLVTLDGTVERWTQADEAYRTTVKLVGVRGVINHLQVRPVAHPDSGQIREAIERALERRAEREAKGITVMVRDGKVTLTGRVHSWYERRAVVESATHAPGVRTIRDLLVIEPDL